MRIVNPGQFEKSSQKSSNVSRKIFATILLLIFVLSGLFLYANKKDNLVPADTPTQQVGGAELSSLNNITENTQTGFRQFNGNEFRLLSDNFSSPTLKKIETAPGITGNDIADGRIRKIAENRGYKLRSIPVEESLKLHRNIPIEADVVQPLIDLESASRQAGYNLVLVSGYRSVKEQKDLFLDRLTEEGININDVASGNADQEIENVLVKAAIPGYSKHHTGYTVDFFCEGFEFENFKNSTCHTWLSANNFEIAKTYGFIPSYPLDADVQGPDPEAWEYVWVGVDLLRY